MGQYANHTTMDIVQNNLMDIARLDRCLASLQRSSVAQSRMNKDVSIHTEKLVVHSVVIATMNHAVPQIVPLFQDRVSTRTQKILAHFITNVLMLSFSAGQRDTLWDSGYIIAKSFCKCSLLNVFHKQVTTGCNSCDSACKIN